MNKTYIVKTTQFGYAVVNTMTGLLQAMHKDLIVARQHAVTLNAMVR